MTWPLEPDRDGMAALGGEVLRRSIDFVASLYERPANGIDGEAPELIAELSEPPPEGPGKLDDVLDRLERASAYGYETAGPGYFAYIPGGGVFASAASELYARVTNRYVGLASPAPGLVALEESVVRWLAQDVCGMPSGSGGLLTSGGSMANLSAVVAARHAGLGLGGELATGTLYLTEHAHQSVAKAAHIAGLPSAAIRVVPCTADLRMDVDAAARMIAEDRAAGRRPFLLVASAGTTNAGTIDPLHELAALARREDLWYHIDGAYGGMFRLTARGRDRLVGLDQADSVTLDPHKTLFLPYGLGALVVRDPGRLAAAHESGGHYLQDLGTQDDLPDYAHLGAELTRDPRGARLWLPLHLYGVGAFREALDEKLDLARTVYDELRAEPALEVPREPELSIVAFRSTGGDEATRALLTAINASRRIFLSSTVLDGRFTLRVCIVVHRTHADRVAEAVDIIRRAAREVVL
jgi:aromatic-L-amino-acid decarboxylase